MKPKNNLKNTSSLDKRSQSKHRYKDLSDETFKKRELVGIRSVNSTVEENERDALKFRRGLSERQLKTIFYILESEEDFQVMSHRLQIAKLAKSGVSSFSEWLIEEDIDGHIPNEWEKVKEFVIRYCMSKNLSDLVLYSNESISDFLTRIYDMARLYNIEESEMWKDIRSRWFPEKYHILIYSHVGLIADLIEKIRTYEKTSKSLKTKSFENKKIGGINNEQKNKYGSSFKEKEIKKSSLQCYKCGKPGHFARDCPQGKEVNSILNQSINRIDESLDKRKVFINQYPIDAIFDTGASSSLITYPLYEKLKNVEKTEDCDVKFTLINDEHIISKKKVLLNILYENIKYQEWFYLIDSKVRKIILCNNLVQKFKKNEYYNTICCRINTGSHEPVSWNRPIRSKKDNEDFEKIVTDLEERGIIVQSYSSWLNPVVLVRKRSGELRFTVDFRKLNDLVEKDNFSLPRIEEIIMSLHDAKYFTLIDLKDGFYHVPVCEKDCEKTTFATRKGLYMFKKMPQGFKNSPAIFQRYMITSFKGLVGEICHIYMDDILVFAKTKEDLEINVSLIKDKMESLGMKENAEKRIDCVETINFLGYEITYNKVTPSFSRGEGIKNYKEPQNRKELQRFLGMVNYDRMFLKNITEIIHPLYDLLQKDKKYLWETKHEKAFNEVKVYWQKILELNIPDFNQEFELECDASDVGIGAVLRQNSKPIVYISRALKGPEKHYGITERELLAIVWAFQKLEHYLIGKKFKLYTDHQALSYLNKKINFGSSRMKRWYEKLNLFTFEVIYKPGKEIITADALSRSIMTIEKTNTIIIRSVHQEFNHRKNLGSILQERGYKIKDSEIKKVIQDCEVCQRMDNIRSRGSGSVSTNFPGEIIGADMLEIGKKRRIIIVIDYFSRYIWARLVRNKRSENILRFLKEVFVELPFKTIICDNGREFNNNLVKSFCEKRNVNLQYSIPYYHPSNGRVERANRTIRTAIRKTSGNLKNILPKIIKNYNNLEHRGTGCTPEEAIKGYNSEKIVEHSKQYRKQYHKENVDRCFKVGEIVWIKNENRKTKMCPLYEEKGTIFQKLKHGAFLIKMKSGKLLKRHIKQLKKSSGEGSCIVYSATENERSESIKV